MTPVVLRVHDVPGGRLVRLGSLPASLGRSVFSDVVIEAASVSLKHAMLQQSGDGAVLLQDLGSKNGTFVGKNKVAELVFEANGSFRVGGVAIDLILRDPEPGGTRIGALPSAPEAGETRVGPTVLHVLGLYLALAGTVAIAQFSEHWPPERPTEIFSDAAGLFFGLLIVTFFASLLSKLNTRRFRYLPLLNVVTATMVWASLYAVVNQALEFNLWRAPLRAVVPAIFVLAALTSFFLWLLRELFPTTRPWRRNVMGVVLVLGGFGLVSLIGHYRFEESDKRKMEISYGYPLVDPNQSAGSTGDLLEKLAKSTKKVEKYRTKAREERAADL